MAALAVELGSRWRDVPPAVVAGCARAGVPVIAFHRPVRFIEITEGVHGAVVNAQFALLRARGGDPPPLHRADPAGPRRAGDPGGAVRGRREPGAARGRRRVARLLRVRAARRRPGASRWADVHRAEDRGEAPRGRSRPTSGCSTPPGGGCWRSRSTSRSTRSTAWRSSAPRSQWRSTCSASSTTSSCAPARAAHSCPSWPTGGWRRRRAPARRGARLPRGRPRRLLPVVATWRAPASRATASRAGEPRAPTGSPGHGRRATCAPRCPRPAWPCCSARATWTC